MTEKHTRATVIWPLNFALLLSVIAVSRAQSKMLRPDGNILKSCYERKQWHLFYLTFFWNINFLNEKAPASTLVVKKDKGVLLHALSYLKKGGQEENNLLIYRYLQGHLWNSVGRFELFKTICYTKRSW